MINFLPILLSELHCEVLPLPLELIMMVRTTANVKSLLDSLFSMIMLALFLVNCRGATLS